MLYTSSYWRNAKLFQWMKGSKEMQTGSRWPLTQGKLPQRDNLCNIHLFVARQEVAEQLRKMQSQGVIVPPSTNPWASPVVLVHKKDGLSRFCIDYHGLNVVMTTDEFPLPKIDDLLDQLGKIKYSSILDLASGYWQVQVDLDSWEKLFVLHTKDYMSLTLCLWVGWRMLLLFFSTHAASAEVQTLYQDDVTVFSPTFEDHWDIWSLVSNDYWKLDSSWSHPNTTSYANWLSTWGISLHLKASLRTPS